MLTWEQLEQSTLLISMPYEYVGDYSLDDDDYQFWAINLELERYLQKIAKKYGCEAEWSESKQGYQVIAIYKNNRPIAHLSIGVNWKQVDVLVFENDTEKSSMILPILKRKLSSYVFKNYMRDEHQKEINAY